MTKDKLIAGVELPSGKGIDDVYADTNKTALDLNTPITEDTDVYVEFVDLVDVDVSIADLLASGIKYKPADGEETTITSCVGTGAAYGAGKLELAEGISATFDANCVKVNNVKPNATSTAWDLNWDSVDGTYDTYITLGGPSMPDRYLAVNVKAGCTIKVYCAATGASRIAAIGTVAETATAASANNVATVTSGNDGVGFILEATVTSAGTYYINCSAAISFFRIVVEY